MARAPEPWNKPGGDEALRSLDRPVLATAALAATGLGLAWSVPASAIRLSGTVTEVVSTPPAPFDGVAVGDSWSLEIALDEGALDVDGSSTAGQYREAVTRMSLTLGDGSVSGAPGASIPGGYGSVVSVNLGEGYADWSAQLGLPDASAWAQIALWDESGTPFRDDALPLDIDPADFPDQQSYYLRLPGSSALFLQGELSEVEEPPERVIVPSDGTLTIQDAIDLVADGGTIELEAGTFEETVVIRDKEIEIIGAGTDLEDGTVWVGEIPETVEDTEDGTALITYGAGGGGYLEDIAFIGGDIAITGVEEEGERPAALEIEDVTISETGNAVAGEFSSLVMSDFWVDDTKKSGLKLDAPHSLQLFDGFIDNSDAAGIVVHNWYPTGEGAVVIHDVTLAFHSEGGIVIAGDYQSVIIDSCGIGGVGKAGIMLIDTGVAMLFDNSISLVWMGDGSKFTDLGYGVLLYEAEWTWIQDVTVTLAAKAGLAAQDSGGMVLGSSFSSDRFGGVLQGSHDLAWNHGSNTWIGPEGAVISDGDLQIPTAPPIPE